MFYATILLAVIFHPEVFWHTHGWLVFDWSKLLQVSLPQFILVAAGLLYANSSGAEAGRDARETQVIWALRGGGLGACVCGIAYLASSGYLLLYLSQAAVTIETAFAIAGFVAANLLAGAKGAK